MKQTTVTVIAMDVGPVGGTERQVEALVCGLAERGHRVVLISRTRPSTMATNIVWHRVRSPARPFSVGYPWFILMATLTARRRRAGIVHTIGALVLDPVDVATVHFCHHEAHRLGLRRARRDSLLYRLNDRLAGRLSRAMERRAYRRPERVLVAVSEQVAAQLKACFELRGVRVVVIPNGVDTTAFRPDEARREEVRRALGLTHGDRAALLVAREWNEKGLAVAIEALAHAPGWLLLVAGEGDRTRFGALAQKLGVDRRLRFLGEREDIADVFRAADVFLLPSSYEAGSVVAYEAAASGLPILATRVGGATDVVLDGENGWLLDRSGAVFGRALSELADDSLRHTMGARSRALVERYTWERTVTAYETLYGSLGVGP